MAFLMRKKMGYRPTIWGWALLLIFLILVFYVLLKSSYPFLARQVNPTSEVLVVEGWIPESGIKNAIEFYEANAYKYMIITGVPISQWTYASPFSNMADASAGTMRQFFFKDSIYKVSIPNAVIRDRTYSTAIALKMAFKEWQIPSSSFDIFTMGAHSRRTHLMFSKAFPNAKIGIIADTDDSFDDKDWYKSSKGFRVVFSELVSYIYSRLFFFPDEKTYEDLIVEGRYNDSITVERYKKDNVFADTLKSPLNKADVKHFRGLHYFTINKSYCFNAEFIIDTTKPAFKMPTNTSREQLYRKYGSVVFKHNDTVFTLTAFQNLDYLAKNPTYKKIFIPFKDLSNSTLTYGGGRYLDCDIPSGRAIRLDFNAAYNPYCAYDKRWSCPLPPFENYLTTFILAGEKLYPQHKNESSQ